MKGVSVFWISALAAGVVIMGFLLFVATNGRVSVYSIYSALKGKPYDACKPLQNLLRSRKTALRLSGGSAITATSMRHPDCMRTWIKSSQSISPYAFYDHDVIQRYVKTKLASSITHGWIEKAPNNQYQCMPAASTVAFACPSREPFFQHFPHFIELYLRVFSMILWQPIVFSGLNSSCVHRFMISDRETRFWGESLSSPNSWIRDLVYAVNRHSGYDTLAVDASCDDIPSVRHRVIMQEREYYFLHPADALILTSSVLGNNPCEYHGQVDTILREKPSVMILSRKNNRRVANPEAVKQYISGFTTPLTTSSGHRRRTSSNSKKHVVATSSNRNVTVGEVSLRDFEGLKLLEQATYMRHTDILVTIHGAAISNIIFMRPCSVVIEVLPWLYNVPDYFGNLTKHSGVLHYSWLAGFEHSTPDFSVSKYKQECQFYWKKYLRLFHENRTSVEDLSEQCYYKETPSCRSCFRSVDKIVLPEDVILPLLQRALVDRAECIANHPFYRGDHHPSL